MPRALSWLYACQVVLLLALAATATAQTSSVGTSLRIVDRVPLLHVGLYDFVEPDQHEIKYMHAMLKAAAAQNARSGRRAESLFSSIKKVNRDNGQYAAMRWFTTMLMADADDRPAFIADDYLRTYFTFFMSNDGAVLQDYIRSVYNIDPPKKFEFLDTERRITMLTELLMAYNPVRLTSSVRRRIVEQLGIRPGWRIADIGASPGHLTFAMANRAGPDGHVFAHVYDAAVRPHHVAYMRKALDRIKPANVSLVLGDRDDIGASNKVDMVLLNFCYAGMYIGITESERDRLFASIRRSLKPDGILAIVDNARPLTNLPPHQLLYVDADLAIGQVSQYGYRLMRRQSLPEGMYVMVFANAQAPNTPSIGKVDIRYVAPGCLDINSKHALLHYTILEVAARPPEHKAAAQTFLDALNTGDAALARRACELFKGISTTDKIGDDYTALQWFSEYYGADPARREAMLANHFNRGYFDYFTAHSNKYLCIALKYYYCLDMAFDLNSAIAPIIISGTLLDALLFNNPLREEWEKTSNIVACLKLQPGAKIADVGSGPGYYSFKFAELVGSNGVVYAVDLNGAHLEYVDGICRAQGIRNIQTIRSRETDICVSDKVDLVFLCSLYHAVYLCGQVHGITSFVDSITRALDDDGRLVIADNAVVDDDIRPYHGPFIAKELVTAHLYQFGYDLVETHHFTPQRYVLVFKKSPRMLRRVATTGSQP